jgi:tetratricopeptide (TPR) repeat protein
MSTEPEDNPYLVLGLERTADDRAVRKAYAAKLREFPPEAHPEQFKKVRAAYEILSDKDARARFDEAAKDHSEYPEEVGRRLADVETFLGDNKLDLALAVVDELIEKFPDLMILRFRRGLVLARMEKWPESTTQFDWLIDREPQNATYRLVRARLLRRQDQKHRAELDLREAFKARPDGPTRVALCDALADCDKIAEAITLLDEGIGASDPKSQERLELLLAKLNIVRLGSGGSTEPIVHQLREVASAMGDGETARYVAGRMGETAARLFAQNRFAQGKAAMRDCEAVHPDGHAYLDIPSTVTVPLAALPESGRQWLSTCKPGRTSPTVKGTGPGWFLFLMMCCFGAVAGGIYTIANPEVGDLGWVELALGLGFGALCLRAYLRRIASPIRAFTTVESPYLLQARYDQLDVYSLFYLQNINAVHNHTNGAYTGTRFTITFYGGKTLNFNINGKEYAEQWLKFLGQEHRRAIELLGEGFLEANGMTDAIPPRLLCDVSRKQKPSERSPDSRPLLQRVKAHSTRGERIALGVTLALSLLGVLSVFGAGHTIDVWFVSGLDVPVVVDAGGTDVTVAPNARVHTTVTTGRRRHFVVKTLDGHLISDERVTIPRFADAVVYNVLGSAPVYGVQTIFSSSKPLNEEGPKPSLYAGQTLIVEHSVDYLMQKPPKSISASRSSGRIVKRHVDVLDGGWLASINMLLGQERPEQALTLGRKIVELQPDERNSASMLLHMLETTGADVPSELEQLLAAHPTSGTLAAMYANEMVRDGKLTRARAKLDASTAAGQIGRAILEPTDRALAQLDAILARDSGQTEAKVWAARAAVSAGRYGECAEHLTQIDKAVTDPRELAQCYAVAGTPDLARRTLTDTSYPKHYLDDLALDNAHFSMARKGNIDAALRELKQALDEDDFATAEARFRMERGNHATIPRHAAYLKAEADALDAFPRGPLALYAALKQANASRVLPVSLQLLLVGELIRLGERDKAHEVFVRERAIIVPFDAIEAYVANGTREDQLWHVRLEALGALDLIRARALEQQGQPSDALYARAKLRDPFGLWVRRALIEWPSADGRRPGRQVAFGEGTISSDRGLRAEQLSRIARDAEALRKTMERKMGRSSGTGGLPQVQAPPGMPIHSPGDEQNVGTSHRP